jgi:2-haloacid dehalogenase
MASNRIPGIRACVFDAYGTLFDFNSAARQAQDSLGPNWFLLSDAWRRKQLEYTWLRSLMGRHVNFWQLTGDALDWAMAEMHANDPGLRERLMNLYLSLDAYPDVADTLSALRESGRKTAILSNGTPAMLASAVTHSKLARLLDDVISVEEVAVYKPDPRVYQLALRHLGLDAAEICFVSSNAWDAYAAKAFGLRVAWCNRFGQAPERLPQEPDAQITRLSDLPSLLA